MLSFYSVSLLKCREVNFLSTFLISLIFRTLALFSIFPFCSIFQLFCHIFFYIAVCHSVTAFCHSSKLNHRHNEQNSTISLSINIAEVMHLTLSCIMFGHFTTLCMKGLRAKILKITGRVELFLMQNSY